MSGLYQCPHCKQYYTASEEADREIDKCSEDYEVSQCILVCQCGHKHGIGGEHTIDEEAGPGILMFGFEPTEEDVLQYNVYPAVMLVECDEEDSEISTMDGYGENIRIVYLRRYHDPIDIITEDMHYIIKKLHVLLNREHIGKVDMVGVLYRLCRINRTPCGLKSLIDFVDDYIETSRHIF